MAVITVTPHGILRTEVTPFFQQARAALIAAGHRKTAWIDYFVGMRGLEYVFVHIKKSRIVVEGQHGFLFSTVKIQRVVDYLANKG